ncbi:MAG: 2-dehydropantoate 2-reductase [Candidatus Omnitrophica bacterium]|nr:2-dehydropantoate 2-reductase [Candidatus Omnitrophota bacterium]
MNLQEKLDTKQLRTSVLGAGAVGGYVGGMIAREFPVTLLCRSKQAEALRKDGLKVRGHQGEFFVQATSLDQGDNSGPGMRVTEDPRKAVEGADLVLLCVKSQDTEDLVREIAPVLPEHAAVILLQNGVRNKDVANGILGANRSLETVVLFNSLFVNPGEVTLTATESVIFDESESENEAAIVASKLLKDSGIHTRFHKNVRGILWTKLIINLNNGSSALTGGTLFEGLRDPYTRRIARALMGEGMETLRASGIQMEPIPKVDPPKLMWLLKTPGWFAALVMILLIKPYQDVQSSTWQSRVRGRPTEIDYLNGEIVRLAKEHGREAPLNEKIVELVHRFENEGDHRATLTSKQLLEELGNPE